jgi:hypothetical protein
MTSSADETRVAQVKWNTATLRRACLLASALFVVSVTQLWAAEFRVNSYTTYAQRLPAVASDASGNFVVVWTSSNQDGSGFGIFGQRFNALGVLQAAEFRVNSYTTSQQFRPSVASDGNGNFLVVWENQLFGLLAGQRFDSSGAPQGAEFLVNSSSSEFQGVPRVAADASGNFVVVWHNVDYYDYAVSVLGRRFDASGVPQGAAFQVNASSVGPSAFPTLASSASGNFVVVWANSGSSVPLGVFGRRFDASGAPQGADFQVNSYTTGTHQSAVVTSDASGNFVVVWSNFGQDGDNYGIFGQRFDASGTAEGAEFKVNSYTTGQQNYPAVAGDTSGNFTVVWQSRDQDGSLMGIFGQRFNTSGLRQGSEFRVNTYTIANQTRPVVAALPNGDPVVVWQSERQDAGNPGVFGQIYGDLIFRDGFESGALSHWSGSATGGGDLSASPTAALAGTTTGLMAVVNDTDALYVQDDSPNDERRYRARFYFDPNGFDTGEADGHQRVRLLTALDPTGLRLLALVLRRVSGQFAIAARVRRNDGARDDTGFVDITDAPHLLELDWVRSSAPGASDGSLTLWIDESPEAVLSGLDNDASGVDSVRMGVLSVKTGAAGSLYFDQFESRRQTYIGP